MRLKARKSRVVGPGFRCFLTSSVIIFFLIVFFHIPFSLFHASFSPPSSRVAWRWFFVDDFFLRLKATSSFHIFAFFAGFVALPFRGVGVAFEEPHLRLMFVILHTYPAHQSGLVLCHCFVWGWKSGNYLGLGTGIALFVLIVLGRRILGGKPGVFQRDTSVVSVSVVHERNKAVLLSLSKQHIHVSTNEYRLIRQTCPGTQSVPLSMILT